MSRVQVLWTVDCVVVLIVVAIEVVEIVLVLVEVVVMVSPGWKDSYGNGARWQSPSWEEDSLAAGTTGTCRLLTAATGGSWEGTGGLQVATTRHTRRWGGGSYCAVSVGGYCVHGAISRSGIIRIGCFIFCWVVCFIFSKGGHFIFTRAVCFIFCWVVCFIFSRGGHFIFTRAVCFIFCRVVCCIFSRGGHFIFTNVVVCCIFFRIVCTIFRVTRFMNSCFIWVCCFSFTRIVSFGFI